MEELFGKSFVRSWSEQASKGTPGARRKYLAGMTHFCLGVLLQSAHNLVRSPLFVRAREAVGILNAGLAVQIWGMAHCHDSGRPNEGLRADAKH